MSDGLTDGGADDLEAYRTAARAWLSAHLGPGDPSGVLRSQGAASPAQLARDRALQKQVYEAGYLGIAIPAEYGGQGLTSRHQRIWREESARYAVPAPGGIASHVTLGVVLPTILAHGSEEQKREWVPRMLSGEEIWVQLLSEPGAGSDLAGVLTRATRDGDVWVLNGNKIWSSGAMSADYGICLARTDWDAPKHRGLTWFKVPLHDARVTVRPVREINGGTDFCEEFLDGVPVGDDMVIGEVNAGWPIANTMLAFERRGGDDQMAVRGSGARRGLAPDLVALAVSRGTTGLGSVRQLIARAHINDFMQAQLTKRLAEAMMSGRADAAAASYIKLGVGILDPLRAAVAMEVAGRTGIGWPSSPAGAGSAGAGSAGAGSAGAGSAGAGEQPGRTAALNFLNGRIYSIAGGSNQIQRNIIGERLLGLPREPSVDADKPFREVLRDARTWGIT